MLRYVLRWLVFGPIVVSSVAEAGLLSFEGRLVIRWRPVLELELVSEAERGCMPMAWERDAKIRRHPARRNEGLES